MKKYILFVGILAGLSLTSCDYGPKSSHGFTLPDGDVVAGQQKFVAYRCMDCHEIAELKALRTDIDPIMTVPLGGKTTRIATYGQLVTSIINPSHKISQKYLAIPVEENGRSKMRNYNDLMTVEDLIDIVAFLQDQYELKTYPRTHYIPY